MKPAKEVDEWGGSAWDEQTPGESKREAGLEDLVKKVCCVFFLQGHSANTYSRVEVVPTATSTRYVVFDCLLQCVFNTPEYTQTLCSVFTE